MKIYLSGKITCDKNYEKKFNAYERYLRSQGYQVVNPVKIGTEVLRKNANATYDDFIQADLKALEKCDAIYLLPDWKKSNGAKIEKDFAEKNHIKVVEIKLLPSEW